MGESEGEKSCIGCVFRDVNSDCVNGTFDCEDHDHYTPTNKGRKFDKGKTQWHKAPWDLFEKIVESVMKHPDYRWDLIPFEPLENLVEILTYGAKKYEANNWQKVEPLRYFDALIRHLIEDFIRNEDNDQESKKGHTKHMHCNAMFLDWIKTQMEKEKCPKE